MIPCKRATELLSKAQDEALTVRERLSLAIHLRVCDVCRNFAANLRAIRAAMRKMRLSGDHATPASGEPCEVLPDDAKERIRRNLERDETRES